MAKSALLLGAAALLALCVATILIASNMDHTSNSREVELLTLQEAEAADSDFAACMNQLKGEGMQLAMTVDKECGDVFVASQCPRNCRGSSEAFATTMSCCWPKIINGLSRTSAAAAHAWHAWGFNVENLCGVSFTNQCEAAGFSAQKDVAGEAMSVAERTLKRAEAEEKSAKASRRLAIKAQKRAKKLQKEMRLEALQFKKLRKRFRLARADAARTVIVERMVHNSVKKDLQSAWGLHQQVAHDRSLANKMAAGTQIEQANARNLLKSAHAAKKAVYKMAKIASKAKKAAYRLHKLSMKDLARAREIAKDAKLQRKIAQKAGRDVEKQLKISEDIIRASKKQQQKAKTVWKDLQKEQQDFDAEKNDEDNDEKSEEDLDKKIAEEVDDAEDKFNEFSKSADTVDDAVEKAEDVVNRASDIAKQASDLLEKTDDQQDIIDQERGWMAQQQAQMMAGKRGIAAMEGELDVLKRKYFDLRRAISGLETEVPKTVAPVAQYERHSYAETPLGRFQSHEYARRGYYEQPQYVYPGMPLSQIQVPYPPNHYSYSQYVTVPQEQ